MENFAYILYCLAGIGWSLLIRNFAPMLRNGPAIFSAFGFMAIFMYVFGLLFGLFDIASYVIVYGGILAIVVSLILNIKYRHFKYKSLLSFSSILFVLGAIYLFFALRDYKIYSHDSYSHWGTIVKELFYSKRAFPNISSISTHNDYPMIFSMAQYAMESILGYKESLLYLTVSLYKIVILVGILDTIPKQTIRGSLFFAFLILITYPLNDTSMAIDTLVSGTFLAMLPVYFLLMWFSRPEKPIMEFMIPLFVCLALMPSAKIMSGFAFGIICVAIMSLAAIKAYKKKKEDKKLYLRLLMVGLAVVVLSHSSYYTYYNINAHRSQKEYQKKYSAITGEDSNKVAEDSFKFKDLFFPDNKRTELTSSYINTASEYKVKIIKSTIKEFLFTKFPYAEFESLSYPEFLLLGFALSVIAYILAPKHTRKKIY